MSTVLLDTNIVSYLFKRDSRAALYAPHLVDRELAVAMMTVAELFQWAAIRNWGKPRVRRLEQFLDRYTLLPVDMELCRQWAEVRATRSKAGLPISPQDAWIAATARRYKLALVTHNPDDYQAIPGLTIITEA
jgi:predicted nucleic acid-binding protein